MLAHGALAGRSHRALAEGKEFVMATIYVTGEQYFALHGKLHEIDRQLRQKGGYPYDLDHLDRALQAIVEGRFETVVKPAFPSEAIAREYGYTVVEDVEPTLKSASDLAIVPFLDEGEPPISGEEMRKRAVVRKANLGLVDLKVALDDQAKISAELQPYYIVFSGTLLRSSGGDLCVAYFYWGGARWVVRFDRVVDDWLGVGRLARCKAA